ncbi:hypothetical protein [Vibrio phage VP882]|uniref:Uncharacterized protein n=1 Tax=Vibrio phage VP882 TaxID=2913982 RepID=A2I2Y4_9CAUD|nr:hypothetical protein VPVV882_gp34 [Vibrio phage VP882]ABM73397.1 hypothetical protein [Vibrio phage VP882]
MFGQPRINIEKRLLCLVIIAAQVLKQQQTDRVAGTGFN